MRFWDGHRAITATVKICEEGGGHKAVKGDALYFGHAPC